MNLKYDIDKYHYKTFYESNNIKEKDEVEDYIFNEISNVQYKTRKKLLIFKKNIPSKSMFKISQIVKEHSGLLENENKKKSQDIQDAVEVKVKEIYEKSFNEGLKKGIEKGREEIYSKMEQNLNEQFKVFKMMIQEILTQKSGIIQEQKNDIYLLIKNITKWAVLRELKEDEDYIKRLLERLIPEISNKEKLTIKVHEKYISSIPRIMEDLKKKITSLKNVKIESDPLLKDKGVILETENEIINASLEEQFLIITELFSKTFVGR